MGSRFVGHRAIEFPLLAVVKRDVIGQFSGMNSAIATDYINIAAYKFVTLTDLPAWKELLLPLCRQLGLKGTILLSPEGINLFLAGTRSAVDEFWKELRLHEPFSDMTAKESVSDHQPFSRMLVRLKKEIIAFGIDGIDPREQTSAKISPAQLKEWLDEGREVTLLDTRNDYEVEVGTFHNAVPIGVDHFRDFPAAVEQLPEAMKAQPLVMFCTGGIRCEKAGPMMEQAGFQHVYQLDGGILKYFEDCGGDHYDGECFVFDQRVAVDCNLQETETSQCYACQATLSAEDRRSPHFVPSVSCPHCYRDPETLLAETLQQKQAAVAEAIDPLPGSMPYDNVRPLNVPERFDRQTLIDFLDGFHPHIGRDAWRSLCDEGRIVHRGVQARPERTVRAGERYEHLTPAMVEPDVNADIRILYEDDHLIVVDKPAPLPMHPSGRFNRNTLVHILNVVYAPLRPRAAHRLDANTSGVVVFSKTRSVAARVQPQFESGTIEKRYVARIHGHPEAEQFECTAPIGTNTTGVGGRRIDPDGQAARTEFVVRQRDTDGTSLIYCYPKTGRTNQIRLHLWHLGFPIVGDPLYQPDGNMGEQQTLTPSDPPMQLLAESIQAPASGNWRSRAVDFFQRQDFPVDDRASLAFSKVAGPAPFVSLIFTEQSRRIQDVEECTRPPKSSPLSTGIVGNAESTGWTSVSSQCG